jgi:hypothetical protein
MMKALIFKGDGVCYDIIIGHQALKKMQLQYTLTFNMWEGSLTMHEVPFHPLDWFQDNGTVHRLVLQVTPSSIHQLVTFVADITASTYYVGKADIQQVADPQTHLSTKRRRIYPEYSPYKMSSHGIYKELLQYLYSGFDDGAEWCQATSKAAPSRSYKKILHEY